MVIKLEWRYRTPVHSRVYIFVGEDRYHLAKSGDLTLRHDEAIAFRNTVRQGIQHPGFRGIFESGWEDGESTA